MKIIRRSDRGRSDQGGFTLIEVIAAITLLGLTVSLLLGGVSQGLNVQHDADDISIALWLCQYKLEEIVSGIESMSYGRFDVPWERFSWELQRTELELNGQDRFVVTVYWQGTAARRQISLSTIGDKS